MHLGVTVQQACQQETGYVSHALPDSVLQPCRDVLVEAEQKRRVIVVLQYNESIRIIDTHSLLCYRYTKSH